MYIVDKSNTQITITSITLKFVVHFFSNMLGTSNKKRSVNKLVALFLH